MALTVIALGLAKRAAEDLVTLATTIWNLTKTAPEFTAANPLPADLKDLIDGVSGKLGEIEQTEAALAQLNLDLPPLVDALAVGLSQYANHAESKSKDKAILAGWGFPLRQDRQPVGQLQPPGDLRVSAGDMAGSLEPHWDPVTGAKSYIAEIAEAADGPWTQRYVGTKSSCVISGLVSGKEYWVRVCAVGSAGMSEWSDRASKRAS
jgi:hypothetical protein